ncbi:MAG TPA: glycosyltransferase family 39 protein [Candidatus Binataceae bacterium]|nr:glycosyltransferase family 39 protein [Candidatus Binataceae bacterium]
MSRWRLEVFALIILGLAALAAGIRETPLVDWDEALYAEVAHEAIEHDSYLKFTWNNEAYVKKPPLLFWMIIASFKTFGEQAWAARLPSVAAGIGTLLLLYLSAAAVGGRLAGLCAGVIPLGFYFFVARGGRECATDSLLTFFSTLAIFALTRARSDRRVLWIAGAACGLAILSKGLAGLIPLTVIGISCLFVPGFVAIGVSGPMLVIAVATAVAAPWFVFQAVSNGALFWAIFVKQETLFRIVTHLEANPNRESYTLRAFSRETRYLWVLLLPLAGLVIGAAIRGARTSLRQVPPAVMVWALWLALGLISAGAVQTKLGWYILPALLPVALLAGCILGASLKAAAPMREPVTALATVAMIVLIAKAPARWEKIQKSFEDERARSRPSYVLGTRAHAMSVAQGAQELFFVGEELPTLVYYSGLHVHFVPISHGAGFALINLNSTPTAVADHQLVMLDQSGAASVVGNLGDEWNLSGPPEERDPLAAKPDDDAARMSVENESPPSLIPNRD